MLKSLSVKKFEKSLNFDLHVEKVAKKLLLISLNILNIAQNIMKMNYNNNVIASQKFKQ